MASTGQEGGPLRRLARLFGFGASSSTSNGSGNATGTRAAAPAVRQDWATLPPLRTPLHRRVDESSHITQFSTDVRRHLDTPASLAPLGHQVAMEAPRGIATGIARVVDPRAPQNLADLTLPARDHARHVDDHARWPTPTPTVEGDAPRRSTPASERTVTSLATAPPSTSATTSPAVGRTPEATTPRILRAAQPAASPTPSPLAARPAGLALRRVRAVPDDAPHPARADRPSPAPPLLAGHDDAPAGHPQGAAPSAPDRPTLGADPLIPPPAADGAGGRAEPAVRGQREDTDRGVEGAPRLLPPVERPPSGVGPALSALPPTARPVTRAQRQAAASVTGRGRQDAIAKGLEHLMTPRPGHADPAAVELPIAPPPRPAPPRDPSGPPVAARRLPPRPGHVSVQRATATAPLVGGRPPLVAPRRAGAPATADGDGSADAASVVSHREEPPVVPIRWQTSDHTDPAATLSPSPPPTVPSAPRPRVARATATEPSQTSSPRGRVSGQASPARPPDAPPALRPTTAPTPTAVPLRRRHEPATPATTPTPGGSRAAVDAGPQAEGLPLPRFPALLRAVDDAASVPTPTAAAGPAAGPVAPARPASPPPPVQREAEAGAASAPESADGAPAAGDTAGDTATDVNAMFRKLYPRVRDELRWELRVQRERAGMLSDPL